MGFIHTLGATAVPHRTETGEACGRGRVHSVQCECAAKDAPGDSWKFLWLSCRIFRTDWRPRTEEDVQS